MGHGKFTASLFPLGQYPAPASGASTSWEAPRPAKAEQVLNRISDWVAAGQQTVAAAQSICRAARKCGVYGGYPSYPPYSTTTYYPTGYPSPQGTQVVYGAPDYPGAPAQQPDYGGYPPVADAAAAYNSSRVSMRSPGSAAYLIRRITQPQAAGSYYQPPRAINWSPRRLLSRY